MLHKTITITVNEDGTVKTDYSNFTGADCLAAGKQLHALIAQLGIHVTPTDVIPKPELLAALSEQQTGLETSQEVEMEE